MKSMGAIVVTGAAGGLGASICEAAYELNFPLALIGRNEDRLKLLKKELKGKFPNGPRISIHSVDLVNEKMVRKEFSALFAEHGTVRALVNNAATWIESTELKKLSSAKIKESLDLNFFSAFHATQALLEKHKKGKDLSIVNIGATASLDAWPGLIPFCIAKGALRQFSRALARDLGLKGIHVSHLVIDGVLDNARTKKLNRKLSNDKFINCDSVAKEIIKNILQDKSAWTFEWDVRPYRESW